MDLVRLSSRQVAALPRGGRTIEQVLRDASDDADEQDRLAGVAVVSLPRRSLFAALRARWRSR
jgi:hypothetical protein